MGFSWFMLLFTLSISLNPTLSALSNSDLITKTCKNTKYYNLCVSTLKSDNSSPKANTKDLALIMVKAGMANANATNSYLSTQILSVANDTVMKKVMMECADKYKSAGDAFQSSVQDLSEEMYDYAYMDVMAASDYPSACRNAFKRYPGLVYPSEIGVREDGLKRICDVVMGIIDVLVS